MQAQVLVLQGAAWGEHRHAPFFVYAVPDEMQPSLQPGQLVLVPFGNRLASGVVWEITPPSDPPPSKAREEGHDLRFIREIVDPIPLLDATRRALAEWLASYYVCGLIDAARLLAPGMTGRQQIDLVAAAALADAAPPAA